MTADGQVEGLAARALSAVTWPGFARLTEARSGVRGGCWCLAFHDECRKIGTEDVRRSPREATMRGAMILLAGHGGGTVEAFSEDTAGRRVSGSFL